MSKKVDFSKSHRQLPDEVRSLIIRKLQHMRQEQERRWTDQKLTVFSKLSDEILENIKAQRFEQAFYAALLSGYSLMVVNAVAMTKEWPTIVWESIVSILDKALVTPVNSQELNVIVDEHAWQYQKHPFTLDYIDFNRFRESVLRVIGSYGINCPPSLDSQLSLAIASGQSSVINTARQERERIGIAIDEHVIAQRQSASSTAPNRYTPSDVKREARKLETQAMYASWQKKYRELKRKSPDRPDSWHAGQIAKSDIANGRDAETIRKHMKK